MKTTITRILCVMLVLVMALTAVGCKDKKDPAASQPSVTTPINTEIVFPLEEKNWNGERLTIATLKSDASSFFTMLCGEEMLGYEVHDAIFQRDLAMYDRFGIDVYYQGYENPVNANGGNLLSPVQQAIKGKTYICDMINANLKGCILSLAAGNHLYNINSMPLIDMENAWWASYFAEGATYSDKLFYTAGMTAGGGFFKTPYVMVCNTELQRDVYLEDGTQMDIFALVDEGNWTISTMIDIVTDYSMILDGSRTEFDISLDRMAYLHVRAGIITGGCHFVGAGGKFCTTNEDGELDVYDHLVTQSNQQLIKDLQNLFALVKDGNCYGKDPGNPFGEGRALFIGNSMELADGLISCEYDYAIIPCPKSNNPSQTEYLSGVNTWTPGFTAYAANLENAEFVAYASEALGWLSYVKVRPEVYDATLCLRLVREDDRQVTIMDEIYANLYIDLNYLNEFGGSIDKLCASIYNADQNYFTNISKLERAIGRDVNQFISNMTGE